MIKKMIFKLFLLTLPMIFISCNVSNRVLYDNYTAYHKNSNIDVEKSNHNVEKVYLKSSDREIGLRNTFMKYYSKEPKIDSSLIVIVEEKTSVSFKSFRVQMHFIKDFELHHSYEYTDENLKPINIDTIIKEQQKYYGTNNYDFLVNYIVKNGFEKIDKITEHENCDFSSGIGSTQIVLFDRNLKVKDSYTFKSHMVCDDIEFQRKMFEKFN